MTDHRHEWDEGMWRADVHYRTCKLCGREVACGKVNSDGTIGAEIFPASEDPCPERIVQEVVRRLGIELQKANVIQAKRRHQGR